VIVKPFSGLASAVSTMVPAKLSVLVRFRRIIELGLPRLKLTGLPTWMVKSPMWTTVLAEWEESPIEPVPVIVTK